MYIENPSLPGRETLHKYGPTIEKYFSTKKIADKAFFADVSNFQRTP